MREKNNDILPLPTTTKNHLLAPIYFLLRLKLFFFVVNEMGSKSFFMEVMKRCLAKYNYRHSCRRRGVEITEVFSRIFGRIPIGRFSSSFRIIRSSGLTSSRIYEIPLTGFHREIVHMKKKNPSYQKRGSSGKGGGVFGGGQLF